MKLDAKFYGEIRKAKDDSVVPEEEYLVFLAHDDALPETLLFYRDECENIGCDEEHLAAVDRTIARLEEWRNNNPDRLKRPDAKGEKLLDQE